MGVWIETVFGANKQDKNAVTPCMGVWIETSGKGIYDTRTASHPVWVCGLKHHVIYTPLESESHTLYGCVD